MNLLVVSNHPVDKWDDKQKEGWDRIEYIPFPNVAPEVDEKGLREIADRLYQQIMNVVKNEFDYECFVCLQGEYSLCCMLYRELPVRFAFPTTARVVVEKVNEDGSVGKEAIFKFVRWRIV